MAEAKLKVGLKAPGMTLKGQPSWLLFSKVLDLDPQRP